MTAVIFDLAFEREKRRLKAETNLWLWVFGIWWL